jgi:hypothetical protein
MYYEVGSDVGGEKLIDVYVSFQPSLPDDFIARTYADSSVPANATFVPVITSTVSL